MVNIFPATIVNIAIGSLLLSADIESCGDGGRWGKLLLHDPPPICPHGGGGGGGGGVLRKRQTVSQSVSVSYDRSRRVHRRTAPSVVYDRNNNDNTYT